MALDVVLTVACVARVGDTVPAAGALLPRCVIVHRELRLDLSEVDRQQTCALLVEQHDGESLEVIQHGLERRDVRTLVPDYFLARSGRQRNRPEIGRLDRGEEREARMRRRDVRAEMLLDLSCCCLQRG
jgi:hypothetical protein